jgi:hypothetical protein
MKTVILTILLFISFNANSATYYVSTSGSDAANGLTTSTPWATLAYAETNATTAGSIIALKKGDTWAIDNVFEINSGGSGGVYITWDGSLWGTGANAIIKSNSDGGSAPKYGDLVHIAGCSYVKMQNITFDGNGTNRWGIVIGGNSAAQGPTAQNNESYITIQDCSVLNFGTGSFYCLGILAQTWVTDMSNITIQRNTVNGTGAEGIAFYMGRSDLGATPKELTNSYIGYNTVTNTGRSGSLGTCILINNKVTGAIVEHNITTAGTGTVDAGILIGSNETTLGYFPTNIIIRYNDIRMAGVCIFIQQGQAKSADVYYNKLYSTDAPYNGVIQISPSTSPAWTGASFNFYNNTMVTAGTTTSGLNDNTNLTGRCIFKNNLTINTATGSCIVLGIPGSTTHTNNAYWNTNGSSNTVSQVISPYATTDRTTVVSGFEATCIATDPLLTNLSGFDFTLQAGSPCINAGATIAGIPQIDILGNPIVGATDIGAYEYGTTKNYFIIHRKIIWK